MRSIVSILAQRTVSNPGNQAFRYFTNLKDAPRVLTSQQLDARARDIAWELQQRGLAGQRAFLIYPAGFDFITAFMGCLCAGVVAVPLWSASRDRSTRFLVNIAQDAKPAIILTTSAYGSDIKKFIQQSRELFDSDLLFSNQIENGCGDRWQIPKIESGSLAYLQYTSGSTARPRGVKISHGNILANLDYIGERFGINKKTIGLSWLPHYHDMGLVAFILTQIYCGGKIVFTSPATFIRNPLLWVKAISHFKADMSAAPNYAYEICAEAVRRKPIENLDLRCWLAAINGAEPIKAETVRKFSEAFAPYGFDSDAFCPCYGLAESTLMVSATSPKMRPLINSFDQNSLGDTKVMAPIPGSAVKDLVSSGTVGKQSEVIIVDPQTGAPRPQGLIGEIWACGPSIANGYWNNASANGTSFQASLAGGSQQKYLRTGDLGFMQAGHLYVTGRLKDLIILGGINYYPQDIENAVEECHPAVRKNRSAAFQDQPNGFSGLVIAVEINTKGKGNQFAEIVAAVQQAVIQNCNIAAEKIVLVKKGTLPRTTSGKIQRALCRKQYRKGKLDIRYAGGTGQTGSGSPPGTAMRAQTADALLVTNSHIGRLIMPKIAGILGIAAADLRQDQTLYDQGLSSLRAVELILEIEKLTGTPFNQDLDIQSMVPAALIAAIGDEPILKLGLIGPQTSTDEATRSDRPPAEANKPLNKAQQNPAINHVLERVKSRGEFKNLEATGQLPFFKALERNEGTQCTFKGKKAIMLGSNNYLGLTASRRVREAAAQAAQIQGPSLTGSRLLNGTTTAHRDLEKNLADFLGYEDAIVFTTGYQANLGLLSALLDQKSYLILDDHCHASIYDGAFVARARVKEFRHNDINDLEHKLAGLPTGAGCLVMVDGVYSMMGDIAPLPQIDAVCKRYQTPYAVDEAHALGVLGKTGRGTQEHFDFRSRADLLTGTFSKALASIGGWVAGESDVIDWIRYNGRPMLFSASLPPPLVAAAATALDILRNEPEQVKRLSENARWFRATLVKAGFKIGHFETPIISIMVGDEGLCFRLAEQLLEAGLFVNASVYPAVPRKKALIRTSVMATHTKAHLDQSLSILIEVAKRMNLI